MNVSENKSTLYFFLNIDKKKLIIYCRDNEHILYGLLKFNFLSLKFFIYIHKLIHFKIIFSIFNM